MARETDADARRAWTSVEEEEVERRRAHAVGADARAKQNKRARSDHLRWRYALQITSTLAHEASSYMAVGWARDIDARPPPPCVETTRRRPLSKRSAGAFLFFPLPTSPPSQPSLSLLLTSSGASGTTPPARWGGRTR